MTGLLEMNKVVSKAIIDLVLDFNQAPQNYSNLIDIKKPLPEGVGLLLEFVSNAHNSNDDFNPYVEQGLSPEKFIAQSSFFIEKVLFVKGADYYRELGLNPGATLAQVHRHFELLMSLFCKEKGAIDWNKANFARFNHAYGVLSNEKKREIYDAQINTGKAKTASQSHVEVVSADQSAPAPAAQPRKPSKPDIRKSIIEKVKANRTVNTESSADIDDFVIEPEAIGISNPAYVNVDASENVNVDWPDYDINFSKPKSLSKSLILRSAPKFLTKFRPAVMGSVILIVGALGFYMFSSDSEPDKLSAVELRKNVGVADDSDIGALLADNRSSESNQADFTPQSSEALMASAVSGSIEEQQFSDSPDSDRGDPDQNGLTASAEQTDGMSKAMRMLDEEDVAKSSLMVAEQLSDTDRAQLAQLAMADTSEVANGLFPEGSARLHNEVSFDQVVSDLEKNGSVVDRMQSERSTNGEEEIATARRDEFPAAERNSNDGLNSSQNPIQETGYPSNDEPEIEVGMRVRFEIPKDELASTTPSNGSKEKDTAFSGDEFILPTTDTNVERSVAMEQQELDYFGETPIYEGGTANTTQEPDLDLKSVNGLAQELDLVPKPASASSRVTVIEDIPSVTRVNSTSQPVDRISESKLKVAKLDSSKSKKNIASVNRNTPVLKSDSKSDQIVVIVNSQNNESISEDDIKNIYADNVNSWNSGKLIEVYNLPVNEPLRNVFSVEVLGMSPREVAA
jgi:curved DNA-binding protein CbpA